MKAMIRAATLAALALLAACAGGRTAAPTPQAAAAAQGQAGQPTPPPKDAVAKVNVVCHTERPIGSNIAKRVCYREDDLEKARARTQDDLVRMLQQGSAQPRRD